MIKDFKIFSRLLETRIRPYSRLEESGFAPDFGDLTKDPDFKKFLSDIGVRWHGDLERSDLVGGLCAPVALWMSKGRDCKIHASFVSVGLLHAVCEIDGRFYDGLDTAGAGSPEAMQFYKKLGLVQQTKEYSPMQFAKRYVEEYEEEEEDAAEMLSKIKKALS